jgi:hypothetical protein
MEPGALPARCAEFGPAICGCEHWCGCWYWEWEYDDGCGVIGAKGGGGCRVGTATTSVCRRGRFCDMDRLTDDAVGVAVIPRGESAEGV